MDAEKKNNFLSLLILHLEAAIGQAQALPSNTAQIAIHHHLSEAFEIFGEIFP